MGKKRLSPRHRGTEKWGWGERETKNHGGTGDAKEITIESHNAGEEPWSICTILGLGQEEAVLLSIKPLDMR